MKSNLCHIVLIALSLVCFSGCKPSARKVAVELSKIPVGIPRTKIYEEVRQVYPGKIPKYIETQLQGPAELVTRNLLKATEELIQGFRQRDNFATVCPQDLFTGDSPAYYDAVGLAAESAHGNGCVFLFYDTHTNYVGFMAASTEIVSSK